ncbi:FAD/NAD(P)-binding protein [Sphingoaurantiacus capsulatus]|uniref:FAD/NAD(P)-binding protein n=1 Tax=Sphingoaurantiacus capsulatus TaxID=1771310 RepID=A0ABV7X8A3_9SPHN
MPNRLSRIAIVGAGFSGSLFAINLVRHDGPDALLIERGAAFGRGVAYSTGNADHLLNVRAANMSALPDAPAHFADWLAGRDRDACPTAFVPRATYGAYLGDLLAETAGDAGTRLVRRRGEVVAIEPDSYGVTVVLADGLRERADAAVLATGNLPPHAPPGIDAEVLGERYFGDPWDPQATRGLDDRDTVLLLGTGLTMVDVALALDGAGFRGRLVALSRRGLLPRAHAESKPGKLSEHPPATTTALLRAVRSRAEAIGWRGAVDELRPFTQELWRRAPEADRARFLRHLRPWWDVHRHRLAPEVAARVEALVASGRLEIHAGKPVASEAGAVRWRPRGSEPVERIEVSRVINCTGPAGEAARAADPLLRQLLADGLARPDAFNLGLDVDADSRLVGADGTPQRRLYALGPVTRGAHWEITAVPDIRAQVWHLARRVSNAHWVGGEGL